MVENRDFSGEMNILGVCVKNRGFLRELGVSMDLWSKIGVFVEKWWFFRKMGVSWVFGQEFREK